MITLKFYQKSIKSNQKYTKVYDMYWWLKIYLYRPHLDTKFWDDGLKLGDKL